MIECVAWLANIEPIPKAPSFFKERGGVPVHNESDLSVQPSLSMVGLYNPVNHRDSIHKPPRSSGMRI